MSLYNFCAGRGCGGIDSYRDNVDSTPITTQTVEVGTGNNNAGNISEIDGIVYLAGEDPKFSLNGELPPPDGKNNAYSNSGSAGRYRDTKLTYEKDYLISFNLITGILISLFIISKKT
tara:strand:+ start:8129 stop:8482 length:354 start_codon:yes stop_codon:yes gene_type:complete